MKSFIDPFSPQVSKDAKGAREAFASFAGLA
jgi:hypothetical protein